MDVDQAYEEYDGRGVLQPVSGTSLGLHRWSIIGYDDADDTFEGLGSWGTGWGELGFGRISPSILVARGTADIVAMQRVPRDSSLGAS